jgi:hypothetical protein
MQRFHMTRYVANVYFYIVQVKIAVHLYQKWDEGLSQVAWGISAIKSLNWKGEIRVAQARPLGRYKWAFWALESTSKCLTANRLQRQRTPYLWYDPDASPYYCAISTRSHCLYTRVAFQTNHPRKIITAYTQSREVSSTANGFPHQTSAQQ